MAELSDFFKNLTLDSLTIGIREAWSDQAGGRTAASAATVVNDADIGNIGKDVFTGVTIDLDTLTTSGFFRINTGSTNTPTANQANLIVSGASAVSTSQIWIDRTTSQIFYRVKDTTFGAWVELWGDAAGSRTAVSAATVVNNADAGNIGKGVVTTENADTVNTGFSFSDDGEAATTRDFVFTCRNSSRYGQISVARDEMNMSFRNDDSVAAGGGVWHQVWHDLAGSRTAASAAVVVDDADAGNIGKTSLTAEANADLITENGFFSVDAALNLPVGVGSAAIVNLRNSASGGGQLLLDRTSATNRAFIRSFSSSTYSSYEELLHSGNTGIATFDQTVGTGTRELSLGRTSGDVMQSQVLGVAASAHITFRNDNGQVGSVITTGTATAFNVASDPRLKDFNQHPADFEIDQKFYEAFSCFKSYNFKTDLDLEVWGFDAHLAIDAGLDFATEGEGSRRLKIGDVYKTTEGDDGKSIEHKVTPAGVDLGKLTPILMAKMELQDRTIRNQAEKIAGLEQQMKQVLAALESK